MQRISRALLFANVLSSTVLAGVGTAADPVPPLTRPTPFITGVPRATSAAPATATARPARPAEASPVAYWGPAPPPVPKRKPSAVRRLWNRIGTFLGADEEMGTMPTYRDPATGRTNTGASKPYMMQAPQ